LERLLDYLSAKPVVLNIWNSEAHYFRWENFCSPPSLIIGISWSFLPSNQHISLNLMLYCNKIIQFCSKLSKMTRLEAHWKLSTAHRLRNTDLFQLFQVICSLCFVGTILVPLFVLCWQTLKDWLYIWTEKD